MSTTTMAGGTGSKPPFLAAKVEDTAILDGLGLAVMAVDIRCKIMRFNGPAESLTGLSRDDVLGRPCSDVLKATLCNTDCPVRCALRTATTCQHGTVVIQPRAERPVTVEVTASALFGRGGAVVGAVGLLRQVDASSEGQVRLYGSRVFISRTPAMRRIFDALPKLATAKAPLLVAGGRGSGRSALAETVHNLGDRKGAPLVVFRCQGEEQDGSQLTGDDGAASQARDGTLLLEDICGATVSLQRRLLAWLEEGGDETLGVRLIATATSTLTERLERGRFRRDLYYRLNVLHVALPDLKDRAEDIPLLAQEFVEQLNLARGRQIEGLSVSALRRLMESTFHENVRELRNVIEVAHARCAGPLLEAEDLPILAPWRSQKARAERERIRLALREAGGNVTRAAEALGMHRTTLWRKLKRLRLVRAKE